MPKPFTFSPPAGGDVVIKSSDAVTFRVHSALLGLASSVFSDMISSASKRNAINLAEDAESISLMLSFIYPSSFTTLHSFEAFEKSLRMADKYDMPGILKALDFTISHSCKDQNLAHHDPVRAFKLAIRHGLRETQTLAASLIEPKHYDFHDPKQLKTFAAQFPASAHLVGLVGAQGARLRSMCEILFDYSSDDACVMPELDRRIKHKDEYMMCKACLSNRKPSSGCYFPSWLHDWCWLAFTRLSVKPLEECQDIFRVSILKNMAFSTGTCMSCVKAARTVREGRVFERWGADINECLDDAFHHLDHERLHAL
ncbi:hypothetical protein BDV93DRAFT_540377 [Ceratobasidium sp. AG-I]|nr:hypothetical protein BDV93DRAFT_540377 [Ceratobasidium sp. AG-I]